MAFCPFMSKGTGLDELSGCIKTCALNVNGMCSLNVLAQKALADEHKAAASDNTKNSNAKAADSSGNA